MRSASLSVTIQEIELEWRPRWFERVQVVDGQIYAQKTLGAPEVMPIGHVGVVVSTAAW